METAGNTVNEIVPTPGRFTWDVVIDNHADSCALLVKNVAMSFRLGVDLGTTYSAAAVADGSGPPHVLGLGNRAMQIPSVLYVQTDGSVLVGEIAERRGAADPARLVRESKRRIGDPVPLMVGGMPFTAQGLAGKLLRWIVARASQRMGEAPEHVVVTHPANWGPFKLDLMQQVVLLADLPSASLMTEPEAAAAQYASTGRVSPGSRIAVYDLGGGTFDACVLGKSGVGFEMLGRPEGIEHLGGIDFDEAVFQHVVSSLGGLEGLDVDNEDVVLGLSRLRRDCVEAKEALSEEVDAVIPVSVPGLRGPARITRGELEGLVRPALLETHTALRRAMRSAGVDASDLSALVLVGGSSRMPLVGQLLEQELGLTTSLDSHPKHDVAMGAVQPAAERAREAVVVPDAAPRADTLTTHRSGGHTKAAVSASGDSDRRAPAQPPAPHVEDASPAWSEESPSRAVEGADEAPHSATTGTSAITVATTGHIDESGRAGDEDSPSTGPGRPRQGRVFAAVVAVLGIVAVVAVVFALRSIGSPSPGSDASEPTAAPIELPRGPGVSGTQMLLTRMVDGTPSIWTGDAATGHLERVSPEGYAATSPVLSPNRKTVIYLRVVDGNATLRVMGAGPGAPGDQPLLKDSGSCQDPLRGAWVPGAHGSRIVLVCGSTGNRQILVSSLDGGSMQPIASGTQVYAPTVSPRGDRVAYVASDNPGARGGRIEVVGINGRGKQQLTDGRAVLDSGPVWSPDGKRIAFKRAPLEDGVDGNGDIWTMTPEGTDLQQLTDGKGDELSPTWSPGGHRVAYLVRQSVDSDTAHVWTVGSEGGPTKQLWPDVPGNESMPAWSRR